MLWPLLIFVTLYAGPLVGCQPAIIVTSCPFSTMCHCVTGVGKLICVFTLSIKPKLRLLSVSCKSGVCALSPHNCTVSLVYTDRALSNYWDLRLKSLAFTAGQDDQSAEQSVYEIHSPYISYFLLLYCYCKYTHICSPLQFTSLLPILLYLSLLSYRVLHLWKCPFFPQIRV